MKTGGVTAARKYFSAYLNTVFTTAKSASS